MWYSIYCQDNEDSLSLRKQSRSAHLARLENLKEDGRLLVAGPFPSIDNEDPGENGFTGSLIIAQFDSLKEAQQWADADPYLKGGVYRQVIVKPFKKVLP